MEDLDIKVFTQKIREAVKFNKDKNAGNCCPAIDALLLKYILSGHLGVGEGGPISIT